MELTLCCSRDTLKCSRCPATALRVSRCPRLTPLAAIASVTTPKPDPRSALRVLHFPEKPNGKLTESNELIHLINARRSRKILIRRKSRDELKNLRSRYKMAEMRSKESRSRRLDARLSAQRLDNSRNVADNGTPRGHNNQDLIRTLAGGLRDLRHAGAIFCR